jgi:tetratricopeptide (TPR) repeat protein
MKRSTIKGGIFAALAALCIVLVAGCERASGERREARDRHLRRAQAAKQAQDIDRAIAECEKALQRRPDLALAHRELGLMLDNYRQDYVAALYHYQRYLQLRPDSPHRADIEALIQRCRISFAAQIAESPAEMKQDLQVRDERIQNLELEVSALREKAGVAGAPATAGPAAPPPKPAGTPAGASLQVHVVQAGENLGVISSRYYGTPAKWKTIFNANRDRVPDANNLRVGTRLDIPPQ